MILTKKKFTTSVEQLVIDKKLSTNQTKINQQKLDTSNTNTDLENKVNAADSGVRGMARKYAPIGFQNQSVKNRKNEGKK